MEGGHAREAPRSGPTSTLLAPQTRTLAPPQVHSGDAVFLDKERCFGVDVVPGGGGGGGLGDAAPRRAAKRSPTAGGGDQGADEESPPKKQAISAQSGVTVGPSPDASAKVSPSKATGASASTSPTASSRLLFAFVGVTHDGMMRRLAAERLRAKCVGLAASSAPPTGTTHVILPNTPAPALAAALRQSGVLAATGDGLPAFAVVPEAWVAACNRARAVVDTTPHAAALARALTAAEAAAVDAATVAAKTETTSGGAPRAGSWRARGSKARGRAQEPQASPVTPSPGMLSTPDASQSPLQPSAAVAAAEAKASVASAAVAGPSGAAVATAPPPAHATAVATVPVPGPLTSAPPAHPHAPAYHAAARTFTGGASGVAWGTGDVWVEPYTVEGANRTLDKLFGHYAHAKEALPASRARHASVEDRAWGELPACGHVACCGRGSCLVAPLQELCDNYLDADKTTFFKKRHLKNGIEAVKCSPHPLRTPADVAALVTPQGRRLGRETIAKIAEVVEHGDLLRNVAARTDERHKTLKLLTTIYGVGEKTAALWYRWEGVCIVGRVLQGGRHATHLPKHRRPSHNTLAPPAMACARWTTPLPAPTCRQCSAWDWNCTMTWPPASPRPSWRPWWATPGLPRSPCSASAPTAARPARPQAAPPTSAPWGPTAEPAPWSPCPPPSGPTPPGRRLTLVTAIS